MKKKHRTRIPDFSRPVRPERRPEEQAKTPPPVPAPRVKPQSTSAKSGRRGQ
jgi:hypothetical protein